MLLAIVVTQRKQPQQPQRSEQQARIEPIKPRVHAFALGNYPARERRRQPANDDEHGNHRRPKYHAVSRRVKPPSGRLLRWRYGLSGDTAATGAVSCVYRRTQASGP